VRGRPFRLSRGRDQKLQLVHVRDAAAATLAACFVDEHGIDAYNITGGIQPTLGEVLDLLSALLPEAVFDVGPGVMGGDRQGLFDIGAARRELGYEPRVTLEDGLREYVDRLRDHEF
jgi:nucleoside-diphosphate-sugar epimerase